MSSIHQLVSALLAGLFGAVLLITAHLFAEYRAVKFRRFSWFMRSGRFNKAAILAGSWSVATNSHAVIFAPEIVAIRSKLQGR